MTQSIKTLLNLLNRYTGRFNAHLLKTMKEDENGNYNANNAKILNVNQARRS